MGTLIILLIVGIAAFGIVKTQTVKVATVECTDLVSGDIITCRVKYQGLMHPLNRQMVIDYAKQELENDGVMPNNLTLVK